MLAEYGQVYGTDLSGLALEFCAKRGFKGVCQANIIEGLPFPEASFDVITALDVIEHLKDDHAGLYNLWQVLKPGGLLIVSVPAYQFLFSYWDEMLGHERRYTTHSMQARLEQAGFEIERATYSNSAILIPAATFRLLKGLFLRRQKNKTKDANTVTQALNEAETDFVPLPALLNQFLIQFYRAEASLIPYIGLPFGLAVLVAARKPLHDSTVNSSQATQNEALAAINA
jgi:2-polyprenyl-3-methyl-5-hydroxy-6-metoxy-1,4-benzoquinol methylase